MGGPYYYPYRRSYYYYPAPAYYYPAPAYYEPAFATPPVEYIEQGPAAQGDWFYCAQSGAYYPDVLQCPAGWQRVAPQPPMPR